MRRPSPVGQGLPSTSMPIMPRAPRFVIFFSTISGAKCFMMRSSAPLSPVARMTPLAALNWM